MLNIKMTSLLSFLGSGGHTLSILKYCVIYPNRLWTQQMVMWVEVMLPDGECTFATIFCPYFSK